MPGLPGWAALAGLRARLRSLRHGLLRRADVESEMLEEFRHHVAMRADDLVRQGLPPDEAARRARVEFGHMDTHRERARTSRGLRWFDQVRFSWLDVKLGLRMLVKHPILGLAAIFALAVGIPVGIAPAHVARALAVPLPGDTGNRVRAIRIWDPVSGSVAPAWYDDFAFWSREMQSFSAMAAFRTSTWNVASGDGRAAPVAGAELSTSAFGILRAVPQLGRTLDAADGEPGAPDVVVIGHSLWQSRFGADPGIVGHTIRVGPVLHMVVGVMPAGFRFPSNEQLWLPLRVEPAGSVRPVAVVRVVGRLADGVSEEQAQAEVSAAGLPPLAYLPESRGRLRSEVVPFGLLYMGLPRGGLDAEPGYWFVQFLAVVLLLVACGNVAMLVFARTATRLREIAIRTELGASRSRIVSQIFVETFVLAILAAGVGVFSIDWLLRHVNLAAIAGETALPYWLTLGVTGDAVVQALAFATVSATLAGVIPALRITGHGVHQRVHGQAGIRFGRGTGALVVIDIAVSVAAVGLALALADRATDLRESARAAGIPAGEYLAVEFRAPAGGAVSGGVAERRRLIDRLAADQRALVAALASEPGVTGVAIGDALPRMNHRSSTIEIEHQQRAPDDPARWVRTALVDVGFFAALGQRVVAGRDFTSVDVAGGRASVIVNTAFVTRVLGGADPLGQRIRFTRSGADTVWREIVGVVGHLGVNMVDATHGEAVYVPAAPGWINPMQVGIHAGPSPERLTTRVHDIAQAIDPALIMGRAVVLSEVHQGDWYIIVAVAVGLSVLVVILVALAASGLYAILSLSVSERTREIGIRSALGAMRRTLVLTVLRRALVQIGVGALCGIPLAALFVRNLAVGRDAGPSVARSVLVAVAMAVGVVLVVGVLSCLLPARRVLAIEASEAMRAEG